MLPCPPWYTPRMKQYRLLMPLIVAALLAGCTSAASNQTPVPAAVATPAPATNAPTAAPPAAQVIEPTAGLAAEPTTEPAANSADGGITAEGYHFLGSADAPATIVMYSDVF